MTVLAKDLDALNVLGRVVVEVVRIYDLDSYLHAVQLVFTDGLALTLTVWTDWRLVVELRSEAVIPDYLWPPEPMTRSVMDRMTGPVSEAGHSHNEMGELVQARFVIGGRSLLVGSHAGDLTVGHPQSNDDQPPVSN